MGGGQLDGWGSVFNEWIIIIIMDFIYLYKSHDNTMNRTAIGDSLANDDAENPAHYSEVGVYSDISPKREELDESVGGAENRYSVGSVPMTTNDAYHRIN